MVSGASGALLVVLPDGTRMTGAMTYSVLGTGKFTATAGKLTCSGKYFAMDNSFPFSASFTCTDGRSGALSEEDDMGVMTFNDGDVALFAVGVKIARLLASAPPRPAAKPVEAAAKTPEKPLPPTDTTPPEFPLDPTGKPTTEVTVALEADPGGTFTVPVFINKSVEVKFFVDSGAADISLPVDVATTLMRNDALVDADIYGEQSYSIADGSSTKARVVVLKELNVGGARLKNVKASVGGPDAPLLLGQSFLKRFGSWSLDNQRHVLVLKAATPATTTAAAPVAAPSVAAPKT